MHAIRTASAAALALTALSLAAGPAAAGDDDEPFRVGVTPTTIAAGGQVTLTAHGCDRRTTVTSGIFDTVRIGGGGGSVNTSVDWDAKPDAVYPVTFTCKDGPQRTVHLTIAGGRPVDPTPEPIHRGHGVRAGVGGSLGGLDLKSIGLGGALIAGSLGTAYYLARRRTGDDAA
ncbi:hypothetical protein GTW43_26310 [Streptomyces sp. SID5785]|uniref:hypothetical protein n=1 Tax=Streptomyces sp. SID5785 TaxID=2690309 RepID=UPI0013610456|nr:hypothetical protein [Streptomyces sp. SID5785]MZD08566.1 hypothetical protein [Streptomyces sp. SID5785]